MAKRRKFLAGLGALASGSAAAVGTGAFTSVSADRSVSVDVADDSDALLTIEPQNTSNGEEYASSSGGTVSLDFSETGVGGSGLNRNAKTTIRDILKVRNQGTQDVIVGVTGLPDFMSVYTDDGGVAANGNSTSLNQDNYSPASGNLALVEAGETMTDVGAVFYLQGEDASALEDFDGTLTFKAVAVSELDNPQEVRNKYDNVSSDAIESEPESDGDGENSLVRANIDPGSTTRVEVTVSGEVYPDYPNNPDSYQAELVIDTSNDVDGSLNEDSYSDDFRLGYAGQDAEPSNVNGDNSGGYLRQRNSSGGFDDFAGVEIDGFDAVEFGQLSGDDDVTYEFTIDWSAFAADGDTNIDAAPPEFEVNEVFISDGGGVFGGGFNGRAVGLDKTYSGT